MAEPDVPSLPGVGHASVQNFSDSPGKPLQRLAQDRPAAVVLSLSLRQQDHTLLLVGVGPRYHHNARLRLTAIGGEMRHSRWDIWEVAGTRHQMPLQVLPIPHLGLATEDIDSGFMMCMQMCFGASPWRDG
jgi:hypothetical protein